MNERERSKGKRDERADQGEHAEENDRPVQNDQPEPHGQAEPGAQSERAEAKAALDKELESLRFAGQAEVLRQTHPRGMLRRLQAIWNKELEIPVVPVAAAVAMLAGTLFLGRLRDPQTADRPDNAANPVIVDGNGNYYRQDEYERAVASIGLEHAESENSR